MNDKTRQKCSENAPSCSGRRKAIKKIAVGVGALAGINVLPEKWVKPVVEMVVLPAHAQTSQEQEDQTLPNNLNVSLSWLVNTNVTNSSADYDLHAIDPADGLDVFGSSPTANLTHSGNASPSTSGSERVNNTTPDVMTAGTYQIYVEWESGGRSHWSDFSDPTSSPALAWCLCSIRV